MESSVSIVTEQRRNLYWNKYKYCIQFSQLKVSCLRNLDNIDKSVEQHKYWERQRLSGASKWGGDHKRFTEFTDDVVANLHLTADCLRQFGKTFKAVFVGWNLGYIYTDNDAILKSIEAFPHVKVVTKKVAEVSIPAETILLNDPKYQFRTYIRSKSLSKDTLDNLKTWLKTQGKEIEMAPSMKYWVERGYSRWTHNSQYTQDYWFINHNNKSYESMLGMIAPGLVRKTMILQRR